MFLLDGDPHDADHNIQPLLLRTFILVTPRAVLLIVPVRPGSTVHASLSLVDRVFLARCNVLDDRAVHSEFELLWRIRS